MKFTTALTALFVGAVTQLVSAAPAVAPVEDKRDVWDPKMTYPHAGVVWKYGQKHNVTWETADQPKQITNSNGFILLRSEDDETPVLLAWNFDVRVGYVEVTVPPVLTGQNYSLVLFGDSGNWGDQFTIEGPITL
ncbi:hypothetical protein NM688_g6268 [Phlebia brevispora]|uniref:Uncharacterized protein n=1 Tax=Phlebia brevispora TaxID=194682 RepID=A0ACC1SHT9_9APHY|nr:hypothetical protein NM688_g6268 [Phlebia brevispora]